MKMIVAIVRPHAVDAIREAVMAHGVEGMTVLEAKGYGRQRGHTEIYRGAEYHIEFVPKARIEIVLDDDRVGPVTDAIVGATRTGKIGDGKVFTLPVEDALRVRTGQTGSEAI